jgi:hypothetical protein
MLPICLVVWKHGIRGDARPLIQGLLVVFAALVASGGYAQVKTSLAREPDLFEKFWISLPLLASFVVTGRYVFGRLVQLIARSRRRLHNEVK